MELLDALSVRKEERSGRDLGRALLWGDLTALSWNFLASSGFRQRVAKGTGSDAPVSRWRSSSSN